MYICILLCVLYMHITCYITHMHRMCIQVTSQRTSKLVKSWQGSSVITQGRFARDIPPCLYRRLVTTSYGISSVADVTTKPTCYDLTNMYVLLCTHDTSSIDVYWFSYFKTFWLMLISCADEHHRWTVVMSVSIPRPNLSYVKWDAK